MTSKRADLLDDESDDAQLDKVFGALSDPIRRRILQRLQEGPLLVSELAEPFEVSLQAVSRHIQVLEDAGLIQKERTGRISRCSLALGPIVGAAVWINRYSRYWQEQFDALAAALVELDGREPATATRKSARVRKAARAARPSGGRERPARPHKRAKSSS
jgi:DNA-binding transcriptional ArsR family regulator